MPGWVLGWMIGDVAGRIVVSKPFVVLAIWYGLGMLGFWLGEANLGRAYAPYVAVLLPATLLVWTLWHPARSHAKMWLFDGFYVWAGLGIVILLGMAAWHLWNVEGRLGPWLKSVWPLGIKIGALILVKRVLTLWVTWSHRRSPGRSVIPVDE